MPAKSGKQYRFMQMIAHGGKPSKGKLKGLGPSQDVAREFIDKTPHRLRSKFASTIHKRRIKKSRG